MTCFDPCIMPRRQITAEREEQLTPDAVARPQYPTDEQGEPIAIRRVPTAEGKRAAELLMEAVKEGKRGLQEAEDRKRGVYAYQQLQACFRAQMIS